MTLDDGSAHFDTTILMLSSTGLSPMQVAGRTMGDPVIRR